MMGITSRINLHLHEVAETERMMTMTMMMMEDKEEIGQEIISMSDQKANQEEEKLKEAMGEAHMKVIKGVAAQKR